MMVRVRWRGVSVMAPRDNLNINMNNFSFFIANINIFTSCGRHLHQARAQQSSKEIIHSHTLDRQSGALNLDGVDGVLLL